MRPMHFAPRVCDDAPVPAPSRSALDIMHGNHVPIAPGADPAGLPLIDLAHNQCRFPVGRDDAGHRFCAEVVDAPRPGCVNGSYCRFHVAYLNRQPSVWDDSSASRAEGAPAGRDMGRDGRSALRAAREEAA